MGIADNHYQCHHDYALEPFRRFAYQLTEDKNYKNLQHLSWVDRRFLHCGLRFFLINSVAELSATNLDRIEFSEPTLRKITRSLCDDKSDLMFSIAVSHHGLRPEGASDTENQVENWQNVGSDFFSLHKIRLWLYGHYHKYSTYPINDKPFDKTPLWLVQAPTLRVGHDHSARGFCVLELKREDGKVVEAFSHHYVLESGTVEKKSARRVFDKG